MARLRQVARIAGKVVGWAVLGVVLLVVSVLLTAIVVGRTEWGHRKLLAVALPEIQSRLQGRLKIGRIGGNLTRGLELYDVELEDAQHRPAVRVQTLVVHYNLLALAAHTIDLTELRAEGAWVHARVLDDGKLNLATLAKPSSEPEPPPDPNAKPYTIRVGKVVADLDARYDNPEADAPADRARARVHLEAHARIAGDDVQVGVDALAIETAQPLAARVTGKGGVHLVGSAIAADKLALEVDASGRELRKLAPNLALLGRWRVNVDANGPADKLAVTLALRPPEGKLDVDAELSAPSAPAGQPPPGFAALEWKATLKARGIDPDEAVAGTPHGDVRIDARAKGKGGRGTIELGALVASVAGSDIDAHGRFTTSGDANLVANVKARDLTQLAPFGVPGLAGSVRAQTRVERTATHLHVELDAAGQALRFGRHRVDRAEVRVHEHDFIGDAKIHAQGLLLGGVKLDTLKVEASGDPRAITLGVQARGPERAAFDLVAHGTPQLARHRGGVENVKVTGADISIDRLALSRHDQRWVNSGPARLVVRDGVTLSKLELQSKNQRLALAGSYRADSGKLSADVSAHALDLKQLVRLANASMDVPRTDINIAVKARGSSDDPVADVSLNGYSERTQVLGLTKIHYGLEAHYANSRAKAKLSIDAVDESVHGTLDVPVVMTGNRTLAVDLVAKNVLVWKLRRVLPATLANLDGRFDASLKASGTTERPQLAFMVHGRKLMLGPEATDNDLRVDISYKERKLDAHAAVKLQEKVTGNAGTIDAKVVVPVALALGQLQKHAHAVIADVERRAAIDADITIAHLDAARFPFAQLGMAPPLTRGMIDGTIKLDGPLPRAKLDADLKGRGLAKGKLDRLDVTVGLDYADAEAKLALDAVLRGAPALKVRGQVPIDLGKVLDGAPLRQTPLRVDADVAGFDLAKVQDLIPGAAGTLKLDADVRGTVAKPTGKLDATIAGLAMGAMRYDKFEAHGGFDGAVATAKLAAHEIKGGRLDADARLPVAAQAPLAVSLRASHFYVDISNVNLTNPRLVKGMLDATLDARGTRAAPVVQGSIQFKDGQLALASDPRIYQKVQLDVAIDPSQVKLNQLEAHLSDGNLKANGNVTLGPGMRPKAALIKAYARKFPVSPGTFGVWIDADVTVQGQGNAEGMTGTVTIDKGTANLPKIAGGKKLQSTGPLEDVQFVDPQARRAAAKKAEAAKSSATIDIDARIPGPFHVRSKEISTDVKGRLNVAIAGGETSVSGYVETSGGWIELLGRHYTIDKARIGLDGESEPNPQLDIRLTRQLSATMIVIEVHGTAKKPELVLKSDPPIYDQAQVIAAILSGDPANQRVDERSMDQKVTGAVSGLIVNKIKDQIAPNLPIDVIKVDTGSEGSTGLSDTRVEIGKYITDTVYVSYVHQFGSTMVGTQRFNSNEADVEWRFLRRYELEAAFGDAAVGRLNLYWTVRF